VQVTVEPYVRIAGRARPLHVCLTLTFYPWGAIFTPDIELTRLLQPGYEERVDQNLCESVTRRVHVPGEPELVYSLTNMQEPVMTPTGVFSLRFLESI